MLEKDFVQAYRQDPDGMMKSLFAKDVFHKEFFACGQKIRDAYFVGKQTDLQDIMQHCMDTIYGFLIHEDVYVLMQAQSGLLASFPCVEETNPEVEIEAIPAFTDEDGAQHLLDNLMDRQQISYKLVHWTKEVSAGERLQKFRDLYAYGVFNVAFQPAFSIVKNNFALRSPMLFSMALLFNDVRIDPQAQLVYSYLKAANKELNPGYLISHNISQFHWMINLFLEVGDEMVPSSYYKREFLDQLVAGGHLFYLKDRQKAKKVQLDGTEYFAAFAVEQEAINWKRELGVDAPIVECSYVDFVSMIHGELMVISPFTMALKFEH